MRLWVGYHTHIILESVKVVNFVECRICRQASFGRKRVCFDFSRIINYQTYIPVHIPTGPFTISEPQDQEIGEFLVVQERRKTGFEAPKLWKSRSGYFLTSLPVRLQQGQFWSFLSLFYAAFELYT